MIWTTAIVEQQVIPTESNVAIYVAAISGVVAVIVSLIARDRFKSMEAGNALDHGAVVERMMDMQADFREMSGHLMSHIEREERDLHQMGEEIHSHVAGMEGRRLVAIEDVKKAMAKALEPWRKFAEEIGWDGVERRDADPEGEADDQTITMEEPT